MSTIKRLAKMAQETTPDQWVSIFAEIYDRAADLEQQLWAAERREKGLREALEDMLLHYGFDVDIECRKKPDDELEVIQSAREALAQEAGK